MNNHILLSGLIIISSIISACSFENEVEETNTIREISPPSKHLDIPQRLYQVNADEDSYIQLESGTRIVIPANSLIDKNGNIVKGEVDVNYREMHNAIEVMLSGIPMEYDSGGVTYDFETAGMFEIRAYQQGEELGIAEGSYIDVEMASYNEGDDFNFYSLDEGSGSWNLEGYARPENNQRKQNELESVALELEEVERKLKDARQTSAEHNKNKDVFSLNVNLNNFPEFNAYSSVLWQFADNSMSENEEAQSRIFSIHWSDIELQREEFHPTNYRIILDHKDHQATEIVVRPIVPGLTAAQQEAFLESQLSAFEQTREELALREAAANQQSQLRRNFRLANFGIFNWDKPVQNPLILAAEFDAGTILEIEQVYLIGHNNRMLISYPSSMFNNIRIPEDDEFTFIAVTPRNEVAIADEHSLAKIKAEMQNDRGQRDFTIKMTPTGRNFDSSEDVLSFMDSRF